MGSPRRADLVSARSEILAAIRRAAVPPSPAGALLHGAGSASLVDDFARMLASVGGRSRARRPGESLGDAVAPFVDEAGAATLLRGRFAVAENGAVYVDAADLGERTDVVSGEHLVLVVAIDAIVPTMHEAMRRIPPGSRCGWFLSGPSKTADIEQSLVIGAQGARTLAVLLDLPERSSR
jgi:L-lactate dehydrogenase complex protein LldG